jgi:hypothetical protein
MTTEKVLALCVSFIRCSRLEDEIAGTWKLKS